MDIMVGLPGHAHAGWDTRMRPVPANAQLVSRDEASKRESEYNLVIAHNISDLLEVKNFDLPKIFIIHTTLEGRIHEQQSEVSPSALAGETCKYLQLIRAHTVAVSELKRRSWNIRAQVIKFSVDTGDYPLATQEQPHGLRVSNLFNSRRQILLADFHDAAFSGINIQFVGLNEDMNGVEPAKGWQDLKNKLKESRFFVHTANPTMEDGYNMATVEAMACGLPILGNCNPSSPIRHGVEGFLSDNPQELGDYAKRLLVDKALSLKMGQAARARVAEVFNPKIFEDSFLQAIKKAKSTFHGKKTRGPTKSSNKKRKR